MDRRRRLRQQRRQDMERDGVNIAAKTAAKRVGAKDGRELRHVATTDHPGRTVTFYGPLKEAAKRTPELGRTLAAIEKYTPKARTPDEGPRRIQQRAIVVTKSRARDFIDKGAGSRRIGDSPRSTAPTKGGPLIAARIEATRKAIDDKSKEARRSEKRAPDNVTKQDTCKDRPEKRGGRGGGRKQFVPWCGTDGHRH